MKLLVPIDGSKKSLYALRYAADLAKKTGAKLVVMSVQREKDVTIVEPISFEAPVLKERAERVFTLAKETLEGKDQEVEFKMLQGDPAAEIIKYADENKFDMIIIGARGLSSTQRFLLGSVSSKLAYHSVVPVLIIR